MGFQQVGIAVYHNNGLTNVADVVTAFVESKLPQFSNENTCGGGHNHGGGCGNH